jgi:hypothetical protein
MQSDILKSVLIYSNPLNYLLSNLTNLTIVHAADIWVPVDV